MESDAKGNSASKQSSLVRQLHRNIQLFYSPGVSAAELYRAELGMSLPA